MLFSLPSEYLRDAAVADLKNARYVARSRTAVGQFDDLLPRRVGKWSSVYVNTTELINAAVSRSGAAKY